MGVILKSDFREYYDYKFDLFPRHGDFIWHRMARTDLSRLKAFGYLQSKGLDVPPYAKISDVDMPDDKMVIVYVDDFAHRGEGKHLMLFGEAKAKYPDCLSSVYYPHDYPISYRYLRIGREGYVMSYVNKNNNEWRSNVGDVDVHLLDSGYYLDQFVDIDVLDNIGKGHVLYAIDFIRVENRWIAIDFNTSPGINGTPLEGFLSPGRIYDLIQDSCFNYTDGVCKNFTARVS